VEKGFGGNYSRERDSQSQGGKRGKKGKEEKGGNIYEAKHRKRSFEK